MTEARQACPKTQNIPVFIVKTGLLVTCQYNEMQISTNNNLVNRKLEDTLSGKFPPIPVR